MSRSRGEPARRFTIGGRSWKWVYRRMRRLYGLCDYGSRTVTIDATPSTAGLVRLDTEIHEALHALQAFATEEHTAETASTLAAILWSLGYRLTEPHDGRGYLGD
jgi:hypothetical protein